MTKKAMWLSGLGIAAVSVLATAMVLNTGTQPSDTKAMQTAKSEAPKPSLMARLRNPLQQTITVPGGTAISVRLGQSLSTESNHSGDTFEATLDNSLVIGGQLVAPAGSPVEGKLTEVVDSGRVEGRARMTMVLHELEINGKTYGLDTAPRSFEAQGTKKQIGRAHV